MTLLSHDPLGADQLVRQPFETDEEWSERQIAERERIDQPGEAPALDMVVERSAEVLTDEARGMRRHCLERLEVLEGQLPEAAERKAQAIADHAAVKRGIEEVKRMLATIDRIEHPISRPHSSPKRRKAITRRPQR